MEQKQTGHQNEAEWVGESRRKDGVMTKKLLKVDSERNATL